MNRKRNVLLYVSGTVAGFLSGVMFPASFGIRGAVFGAMLTYTVIRQEGRLVTWRSVLRVTWLPAIFTGLLISFFVPSDMELGFFRTVWRHTIIDTINVLLLMTWMTYMFHRSCRYFSGLGLMLAGGAVSSCIRMVGMSADWEALVAFFYPFLMGMLPFILLWYSSVYLIWRRNHHQ